MVSSIGNLSVAITQYRFVQPYVDPKPRSNVIEVDQLSWPNITNVQVWVSVELTDAQVIVCIVDCTDTPIS